MATMTEDAVWNFIFSQREDGLADTAETYTDDVANHFGVSTDAAYRYLSRMAKKGLVKNFADTKRKDYGYGRYRGTSRTVGYALWAVTFDLDTEEPKLWDVEAPAPKIKREPKPEAPPKVEKIRNVEAAEVFAKAIAEFNPQVNGKVVKVYVEKKENIAFDFTVMDANTFGVAVSFNPKNSAYVLRMDFTEGTKGVRNYLAKTEEAVVAYADAIRPTLAAIMAKKTGSYRDRLIASIR